MDTCEIPVRSAYPGEDAVIQNLKNRIQHFRGGIPAQRNPEGAVDNFRGQIHGGERMAAVALGTGGAGADTDTRILEDVQGVLGGKSA